MATAESKQTKVAEVLAAQGPLIHRAMAAILADCGAIGKDRQNTEQKYKFRGIDDVYNELHSAFGKHGVYCIPNVVSHTQREKTAKSGSVATVTIAEVEFHFYATDGSSVTCKTVGEGADYGDKSTNKAMSTAQKYALLQVFLIPTEGDNDTENVSHEFVSNSQAKQPAQTSQAKTTQTVQSTQAKNLKTTPALKPEPVQVEAIDVDPDWESAIEELDNLYAVNQLLKSIFAIEEQTEYDTRWKKALLKRLHAKAETLGFKFSSNTKEYFKSSTAPNVPPVKDIAHA